MKHSLRLYSCTFCHTQVLICSNCDRGQIYCASTCALTARKKSCKQANRRYQKTFKGKMNNALRQRRFRQRSKKIVTDQGTQSTQQDASLHEVENKPKQPVIKHDHSHIQCSFCGEIVQNYVRTLFLHHLRRKKSPTVDIYSQPP